jgi:uncharacterized protein YndB with AHSA1/START domain
MTVLHDTFTIDRTYDASVPELWRAWTDPEIRAKWFRGPDGFTLLERTLDFRAGGREVMRARMPNGAESHYVATIHALVPDRHVIYVYDMTVGGAMMSVTLATMQLDAAGGKARLRYTEQGSFFDGNPQSPAMRVKGVTWHYDNLGAVLAGKPIGKPSW